MFVVPRRAVGLASAPPRLCSSKVRWLARSSVGPPRPRSPLAAAGGVWAGGKAEQVRWVTATDLSDAGSSRTKARALRSRSRHFAQYLSSSITQARGLSAYDASVVTRLNDGIKALALAEPRGPVTRRQSRLLHVGDSDSVRRAKILALACVRDSCFKFLASPQDEMDVCVHRAVSKFDEVDVARALLGMYGKLDKRALAPSSALTRDVALRVLAKALRVCDVNGDDSLAEKIGGEAFKLLMSQDELLGLIESKEWTRALGALQQARLEALRDADFDMVRTKVFALDLAASHVRQGLRRSGEVDMEARLLKENVLIACECFGDSHPFVASALLRWSSHLEEHGDADSARQWRKLGEEMLASRAPSGSGGGHFRVPGGWGFVSLFHHGLSGAEFSLFLKDFDAAGLEHEDGLDADEDAGEEDEEDPQDDDE